MWYPFLRLCGAGQKAGLVAGLRAAWGSVLCCAAAVSPVLRLMSGPEWLCGTAARVAPPAGSVAAGVAHRRGGAREEREIKSLRIAANPDFSGLCVNVFLFAALLLRRLLLGTVLFWRSVVVLSVHHGGGSC